MNGALLVDKPSGPTSHDIVGFTRRLLKTKRVGHTGTLDPLATGLLVMLVGHATRLSQFLVADEKEYIADVRLGIATPTYDAASLSDGRGSRIEDRGPIADSRYPIADGRCPIPDSRYPITDSQYPITDSRYPTSAELEGALDRFRGTFLQTPPPYSAKKVAGVRAYEHARQDRHVELQPVAVTVRELQVLHPSDIGYRSSVIGPRPSILDPRPSILDPRPSRLGDPTLLRLRVVASSGFYVRSLAHDIGQALGCGAHLQALRRTRAGRFRVEEAATLETLEAEGQGAAARLVPMNALLGDLPAVTLTAEGLRRATNGNALAPHHLTESLPAGAIDRVRVLDADGEVLSIADRRADGLLHPLLVLR